MSVRLNSGCEGGRRINIEIDALFQDINLGSSISCAKFEGIELFEESL